MSSTTERTEKEKMLAGEPYQAFDPVLLEERNRTKQICFELNQTSPLDVEKRKELTAKMFGTGDALVESPFYCDYGYNLQVGKNFYANHGCTILDCNVISIGNDCIIAPHVVISAATHPLDAEVRISGSELTAPIKIGNSCWIGASATINPGVTLGDNVVVGAGAVVTKSFPDNVVIAGVPAKVIRNLNQNGKPT